MVRGFDVSNGVVVAGMTDTVANVSTIRFFKSVPGTFTSITDSNRIESVHIDNGTIIWASGESFSKTLTMYDLGTGITTTSGFVDNPVIDDEQIAWTFGDAVEMRVPVTYEALTSDLENGWAQTRFKTIENGNILWGNFLNSVNARLYYAGTPKVRLTDSLIYKDFVMVNGGYAMWRHDFNKLYLYSGSGSPMLVVDSLQCENMYIADGSVGFHGFRVTDVSGVNQSWMYRIATDTLIQLTSDTGTVQNGTTIVDGNAACWYKALSQNENAIMHYNGAAISRLSDSLVYGKFSFVDGIIVWSEQMNGIYQIRMRNTTTGMTTQLTNDTIDAIEPVTDGLRIVWFEGSGPQSVMIYYDIATGQRTKVAHAQPPNFRWLWTSNGKIAWSGDNEIRVYDGTSIARLTDGGDFRPNIDAYVDQETVVWKRVSPFADFRKLGDIYRGKLRAHAAFDAVNISGPAPLLVNFYSRSWEGVRSVSWNFGDGNLSTQLNPSHAYNSPGVYSVTLTVTGPTGSVSETKAGLVRVTTATDVTADIETVPTRFSLSQNYPNPFNPTTEITFVSPLTSHVSLKIFDLLGREVATLVNEELNAGAYKVRWNARGVPSGAYFYRLTAGGPSASSGQWFVETKKLLLLR